MIRFVVASLILGFLALLPRAVAAEQVSISSGEYDGFTRLVVSFELLPEWTAGRKGSGYILDFKSKQGFDFNVENALQSLRRGRITDLDVMPDRRSLSIAVGCDCAAEIFAVSGRRIVVDIRPRPFGAWARHETEMADDDGVGQLAIIEDIEWVVDSEDDPQVGRQSFSDERPARLDPLPPLIDASEAFLLRPFDEFPDSDPILGPLRDEPEQLQLPLTSSPSSNDGVIDILSNQLSRAISQGLVEKADELEAPERAANDATGETGTASQNFRSLTVFDRDTSQTEAFSEATASGIRCFSGVETELSEWGDPIGARDLGSIRRSAVAEDGMITQAGRLRLARYYLSLGFGAEARHLALGMPKSDARDLIEAIGEILDHGKSGSDIFEGQITCQGAVSLWALLAKPVSQADLPQSTDAILASFSALPRHLRSHLGPVLSERLRRAGEPENARTALNAVTRAGGGSRRQDLTAARLALIGTNAEEARKELERLTRGTDFTSAEALVELLLDAQRRSEPPKENWVDDAPSLIRATQGTDIAEKLSISALRSHVPLGRFDALRRSLNTELPGLTSDVRTSIAKLALTAISQIEDDDEFVRSEIGFSKLVSPEDLPEVGDVALIERLYDLGLPQRALRYLPVLPETQNSLALTSKVLLANGSVEQAMALVQDSETASSKAIRAQILDLRGDLLKSAEAYLEIEDLDRATLKAMRSGSWEWLVDAGPLEASALVQSLNETSSPKFPDTNRPENFSALISRSKNRRTSAQALLELTEVLPRGGS